MKKILASMKKVGKTPSLATYFCKTGKNLEQLSIYIFCCHLKPPKSMAIPQFHVKVSKGWKEAISKMFKYER